MTWDASVDVLVVGSGMAGLSAALAAVDSGLQALVLEKGAKVGGGTSYSYGGLWIGNNPIARAEGYSDSREEVLSYLTYLAAGYALEENMLAFLDGAPQALNFFLHSGIPFQLVHGLPDHYYDTAPGSKPEGRMIEAALISGYALKDWQDKVDVSPHVPMGATFEDAIRWGGHGNYRNWDHDILADRQRLDMRGFGAGLVAQFVRALVGRNVPIWLSTPADRLIVEDGAVVGLVARQGEREVRVGARHGVVLATGGYESNPDLVEQYEGLPEWGSVFPKTLTGDGLVMAAEIGARVRSIPLNMAILLGFSIPGELGAEDATFRPAGTNELSFPHTLAINRDGERFADESYFQALLQGIRQFDVWSHRHPNLPCYLVFDQNYVDKYSFAGLPPGNAMPNWVSRGDTARTLAAELGVDADGLERTLRRFNEFARTGKDEDFHRGTAAWSAHYGGDLTHQPNANLGPVERPPFYGVRVVPGGISSTGLLTNRQAQVVHMRGHSIPRLYATGNAAAYVDYGVGYQAGISLARGMTFSYLAVQHMLAGRGDQPDR
jgi:3-oxosteroid 1-dehydrogenase